MARPDTSAKAATETGRPALPAWAGGLGWESDVILSTRARLARNLADLPFPGHADLNALKAAAKRILPVAERREKGEAELRAVEISRLSEADKATLVDSHLISVPHAAAGPYRWALVDDRRTVSVMVNEEDHLRIQAILPGLQLDAAWKIADRLDDLFAAHLSYAVHPKYGYLTSSLSNCGTGLRLSVMAHLPGLAMSGKLGDALQAARTLGVAVRGMYGEHSAAPGDVYQISNGVGLGKSERQIAALLSAVTTYLLTDEQAARELLFADQRLRIEESVAAAQAELKSAERLSAADAMAVLSILRMGHSLGLETGVTSRVFNELLATLRIGVQFVSGSRAQSTFYEETRRPALLRNTLRRHLTEARDARGRSQGG